MFEIWDVQGVNRPYDWQSASRVLQAHMANAYDTTEQEAERGVDRRGAAGRPSNPYQRILEKQTPKHERRRVREARQLMSAPVIHLRPDDTVGDAWDIVTERGFRHLPVLDEDSRLVGILSDRDLLRVAGTPDSRPQSDVSKRPVRVVMRTEVHSARPGAPIRSIAEVMFEHRIGAMPIVDENGSLVGMLTRTDILRVLVNEAPLDLWI